MRIALLTLTRGAVSGGYAKYLRQVVPRLRAHPEVEEVRTYAPAAVAGEGTHAWPSMSPLLVPRWLRREVRAWGADVVFIPSSVYVDFGRTPVVTMVRNMEPLQERIPGNAIGERLMNAIRIAMTKYACRRSSRVIAVSDYVREFLLRQWHLDPEKVGTVPHGVNLPPDVVRPPAADDSTPFLFTAGSLRPSRGLTDVLSAVPPGHRLMIAGDAPPGFERYLHEMRATSDPERVQWLGALRPEEMAWCFDHARVFVMTSRAEACPNTVLEALAHGCVSVSTDQPPMPEFFGDAAIYYRRRDAADCARAVREALALSEPERADLRRRSLERASSYTWDATVDATVRELKKAM